MLLADISGGSAKGSTRGSRGMLGISPLLDKLNALVTVSPPRAEALSLWACYVPPLKRAGDGRASGRACLGNSPPDPQEDYAAHRVADLCGDAMRSWAA